MNTWDKHTNKRIKTLHPAIILKATEFINRADTELGIKLRVYAALRTWEEQTELYAKGRTLPGRKVTWAKAGESYHNYGLAIDVVEKKDDIALWKNPNWEAIGKLGEEIGFTWGGRWPQKKRDLPHFQMTFNFHHSELAEMYSSSNKIDGYVNLFA